MDHLRRLSIFVHAARAENFSAAARQLGITPQAVSGHISELEHWLDVRLFNRTTRKISLTEEGAMLFERCKSGIDSIEDGIRELQERTQEAFGTVRLTVPYGLSQALVVPLLPKLLERYPRITIELLVQNEMPDIVQHAIDVGILGNALPMGSVVARKIASFEMMLCASPRYLKQHGTPRTVEDLKQHRCVNLRDPLTGKIYPWTFRHRDQILNLDLHGALAVNDTETHRRAVLNGTGIGQVASFFAAPHFRTKRLKPLLLGYSAPPIDIYLYIPRRTQLPRKNRLVADFLFEELRAHPYLQPIRARNM
jgi:DNA-binding transcriptional LysR family regulator